MTTTIIAESATIDSASLQHLWRHSFSSLPSSFSTFLPVLFDSRETDDVLSVMFNPRTPDDPCVRYFSIAGRIWHPRWFPKLGVLDNCWRWRQRDGKRDW